MSTAVFGAPEWRARSGRTIKPLEDGTITFQGSHGYLAPLTAMDAEEFFQAKRDADLGRWRYPLDPDLVVYAEDGRARVLFEPGGGSFVWSRESAQTAAGSPQRDAALAYFEAHPERKPWEDAQPEEGWVITVDGKEWLATVDVAYDFTTANETFSFGTSDMARITDARRVWPEEAS